MSFPEGAVVVRHRLRDVEGEPSIFGLRYRHAGVTYNVAPRGSHVGRGGRHSYTVAIFSEQGVGFLQEDGTVGNTPMTIALRPGELLASTGLLVEVITAHAEAWTAPDTNPRAGACRP